MNVCMKDETSTSVWVPGGARRRSLRTNRSVSVFSLFLLFIFLYFYCDESECMKVPLDLELVEYHQYRCPRSNRSVVVFILFFYLLMLLKKKVIGVLFFIVMSVMNQNV